MELETCTIRLTPCIADWYTEASCQRWCGPGAHCHSRATSLPSCCQGILLVAVVPNLLACYATGWALDKGAPAVRTNMAVITIGTGLGECWGCCATGSTLYTGWQYRLPRHAACRTVHVPAHLPFFHRPTIASAPATHVTW